MNGFGINNLQWKDVTQGPFLACKAGLDSVLFLLD